MRSLRTIAPVAMLVLLAACGEPGATPTDAATPSPTEEVSAALPSEGASPSPETTDASEPGSARAEMTITGQLGGDDIEGGCPFLTAEDGTRYEVIWPEGWSIDRTSFELTNPDGEVVAVPGDEVTVHGDVAGEMGGICQIGEIFEAVEVEIPD